MTESLHFSVQLPHAWKEGTQIEPHIHYCCSDNSVGNVVWKLEYVIADVTPPPSVSGTTNSTFGTTTTLTTDPLNNQGDNVHSVSTFGLD